MSAKRRGVPTASRARRGRSASSRSRRLRTAWNWCSSRSRRAKAAFDRDLHQFIVDSLDDIEDSVVAGQAAEAGAPAPVRQRQAPPTATPAADVVDGADVPPARAAPPRPWRSRRAGRLQAVGTGFLCARQCREPRQAAEVGERTACRHAAAEPELAGGQPPRRGGRGAGRPVEPHVEADRDGAAPRRARQPRQCPRQRRASRLRDQSAVEARCAPPPSARSRARARCTITSTTSSGACARRAPCRPRASSAPSAR